MVVLKGKESVILYMTNWTLMLVRNIFFISILLILSVIDIKKRVIPNKMLIVAILPWVIYMPYSGVIVEYIINGLVGGITVSGTVLILSTIMDKILGKESLGGGDIKLLMVTGMYLGVEGNLWGLIVACIIELFIVKLTHQRKLPFGPAISFGAALVLMWGYIL